MSLPSATGSMRSASATAAPPLLPPAVRRLVVGVQRGAEDGVVGVRAEAELRRVGLADEDRARPCERARRRCASVVGHEVLEDRRAQRGADAGGVRQVLGGLREAVHASRGTRRARAARRAPAACAIRPSRSCSDTMALTCGLTASMWARYVDHHLAGRRPGGRRIAFDSSTASSLTMGGTRPPPRMSHRTPPLPAPPCRRAAKAEARSGSYDARSSSLSARRGGDWTEYPDRHVSRAVFGGKRTPGPPSEDAPRGSRRSRWCGL